MQLVTTLGDRRDARSIPLLTQLACSSEKALADAATASLGKIGTPAALKSIQMIRSRSGGELTDAIADALLRCGQNLIAAGNAKTARPIYEDLLENSQNRSIRRSALAMLLASDKDGGRKRIQDVLSGKDDALKPVAIAAIASVPDHGASEEFAALMHHLRPEHQALMVETIAARGDDAARLQVAKALSIPEPMVRRAAIVALGRMADPYFISLLTQAAAASSDPEEARAVEAAFVAMKGGAETDRQLIAQVKLAAPKARIVLIAALAQRLGAAASDVFLQETSNLDPAVAKAAFRALAKYGTAKDVCPVMTNLLTLRDAGVQAEAASTAARLLAKMPEPRQRSAAVCESLGRATTIENRKALLALMPACGDAAALGELKTAMADSEPEVREAAVRALADWPDDTAWDELAAIYRQPRQDNLRSIALRGLVRLLNEQNAHPDEALIGRYKQLFSAARAESDLRLLLGAVAGAAHPDALPLVLPLLANNDVHAEAALAVKQIAESIKAEHPEVAEEALKKLQ